MNPRMRFVRRRTVAAGGTRSADGISNYPILWLRKEDIAEGKSTLGAALRQNGPGTWKLKRPAGGNA
jgi:hypothetical protein